ncbi:MAG: zinc metallopeptidase [Acutalibacteraceae bacterium]|jgi:Zn-dependent membrane protease YugP
MPYYFFDYWYLILVVPALLVTVFAQIKVKTTFKKYSRLGVASGLTGAAASQQIMRAHGMRLACLPTAGSLTDHYDPRNQSIHLSEPVYGVSSVAAVGVAAHETGHALQYAANYWPVSLRMAMIPVTRFASAAAPWLLIAGIALSFEPLLYLGVFFFGAAVLFQLVTLPVEFDASRRALAELRAGQMLTEDELKGAKKVLTAAAMTYVAALLVSVMQFIRLLLIAASRSRRN